MKKRSRPARSTSKNNSSWVPFVDRRILPDIISFKCVKGPLRLFLQLEKAISLLIVIGTCIVVILKFWPN